MNYAEIIEMIKSGRYEEVADYVRDQLKEDYRGRVGAKKLKELYQVARILENQDRTYANLPEMVVAAGKSLDRGIIEGAVERMQKGRYESCTEPREECITCASPEFWEALAGYDFDPVVSD